MTEVELKQWLASAWEALSGFLNSAFFSAAFGALGGAYFGQRIVERNVRRKELRAEIRNTSAAIAISFGIFNALFGLKKQYVRELKENFDNEKMRIARLKMQFDGRPVPPGTEIRFAADLRVLQLPELPAATLQQVTLERLSLVGRPIVMVSTLGQTIHSLNSALDSRNHHIAFMKTNAPPEGIPHEQYFGFPDRDGHVDQLYADLVEAIHIHTDAGIYFAFRLCTDLIEHGDVLITEYHASYGNPKPTLDRPQFTGAMADPSFPDLNHFSDWENNFVKSKGNKK